MARPPMLLRRGLLLYPSWVVDSDPERPAGLVDVGAVRVVVRNLATGARQALSFPATDRVPVLGVLPDRRPPRSTSGAAFLSRVGVTA